MNPRVVLLSIGMLVLGAACAPAQTPRTSRMMREKLGHSQKILEALTRSDQNLLVRETDALARIAASPQWTADLWTPELRGYAESFVKAVTDLTAAAKRNDFDAAAAHYNAMTMACFQCHRRLKDIRLAR
jgi:hypothetical protein